MQSRTHSLSAPIRAPLFKRLESSIPAFRSTPAALIDSSRTFRNGLLVGSVSQDDGRAVADAVDAPDAADLDQDALTIKGAAYDVAGFRAGEWRDDLDPDRAALQAIYESIKDLTPADDVKIHAVKSFVTTPGVNAEKLLIFTESNVTARYLYDELSQSNDAGAVNILPLPAQMRDPYRTAAHACYSRQSHPQRPRPSGR